MRQRHLRGRDAQPPADSPPCRPPGRRRDLAGHLRAGRRRLPDLRPGRAGRPDARPGQRLRLPPHRETAVRRGRAHGAHLWRGAGHRGASGRGAAHHRRDRPVRTVGGRAGGGAPVPRQRERGRPDRAGRDSQGRRRGALHQPATGLLGARPCATPQLEVDRCRQAARLVRGRRFRHRGRVRPGPVRARAAGRPPRARRADRRAGHPGDRGDDRAEAGPMTLLALACALLAAAFFAGSVLLQHGAVRAAHPRGNLGLRTLGHVVRTRGWLGGTLLAVIGAALHLTALSLAPLAIVQPLGVLSLVLTVLVTGRVGPWQVRAAVTMVCSGVAGFVLLSALGGTTATVPTPSTVQPIVLLGLFVILGATLTRGRCLPLSASAAVLFGLGSAVMRAAAQQPLGTAAGLALEGLVLLTAGGWLMHRAYAAGPAAVVVGATTVLDPVTAVAVGVLAYGETPHLTPVLFALQAGSALLAVTGVLVLAGAVPDHPEPKEPHVPNP